MVDHTRTRDFEEARVLGIVRKLHVPKILVINKVDVKKPSYKPLYTFLEDEFDTVVEISALEKLHLKKLLDVIFEKLPERKKIIDALELTRSKKEKLPARAKIHSSPPT